MQNDYIQEEIKIGDINMPIINDNNILWYPIKFISEKILLRRTNILTATKRKYLGDNYMAYNIDYGFKTGGIQLVGCTNKKGMEILFTSFKTGGYSLAQKQGYNNLIKYFQFEIPLLPEFEQQDIKIDKSQIDNIIKKYNTYIQDCIKKVLNANIYKNIQWRYCSSCGRLFPLDRMFFNEDQCNNTLIHKCKMCQGNVFVLDRDSSKVYNKQGEKEYVDVKEHNTIEIYNKWKDNGFKGNIPRTINNKDDIFKIIKYYFDLGFINKDKLNKKYLKDNFNLILDKSINMIEVYEFLFGQDYILYPWHYENLQINLDSNLHKLVFNNYLIEHNIKINDIFNFNYSDIIYKSGIGHQMKDILKFIVTYYDYKYAGYKFKIKGVNYYKNKVNRDFDMKYLIEKDMKIPIEKIPLYITKMQLQRKASSLYYVLHNKKYYDNLFQWINEIYPNKFIENDFVINPYRDIFDSDDEIHINKILHDNFKNVLYNQRNTNRTIEIKGMIPDWIICTNSNCWLIEYFGLYKNKNNSDNKRIKEYTQKANVKIEKYNKLTGYKSLFIYPDDLNNDFKELKNKLKTVI